MFFFPLAGAEEAERDLGSRPTAGSPEGRQAGAAWGCWGLCRDKAPNLPAVRKRHPNTAPQAHKTGCRPGAPTIAPSPWPSPARGEGPSFSHVCKYPDKKNPPRGRAKRTEESVHADQTRKTSRHSIQKFRCCRNAASVRRPAVRRCSSPSGRRGCRRRSRCSRRRLRSPSPCSGYRTRSLRPRSRIRSGSARRAGRPCSSGRSRYRLSGRWL